MSIAQTEANLTRLRRLAELRRQAAERRAVEELRFIESTKIEDKESGALVPFKLWQAQREILPLLQLERLIALKARQLGLTWLDLAHWLYEGTFWGNRLFIIARQTLEDAKDGIHRLKIMHDSLPEKWQQGVVTNNELSLGFANGSRYLAIPSTARIAHGRAVYGGLLDEFALYDDQAGVLEGAEPACARLHIVTTGQGPGDLTEKIWNDAGAGLGRWKRVFLPWTAHPGRDEDWYRVNVLQAPEPRRARRQYAKNEQEAFSSPSGVFFERFDIDRNTAEIEPQPAWRTFRGLDFGYHHPACLWLQVAPSGQLFIVGELAPENLTTDEFRDAIIEMDSQLGLAPRDSYCDPAGKAVNVQTAESEFEILRRGGLNPRGKPSSVRDGCVRIMNALAEPEVPLVVSTSCHGLIRCLSQVKPDKSRPDLYDQRGDSPYQHLLDALRYLLVNLRPLAGGGSVASGGARRSDGF